MTLVALISFNKIEALPCGNPADASLLCNGLIFESPCVDFIDPCLSMIDTFSYRLGFYGDYVFNRHMEVDSGTHPDIEDFEIFTNAGYMALNIWRVFDVFATFGVSNLHLSTNVNAFEGIFFPGEVIKIDMDANFSWSVGGRLTILEYGFTAIGLEAQYFYTKPSIKKISLTDAFSVYPDDDISSKYQEWQFGGGISQRIGSFVPYAMIKWAKSRTLFDESVFIIDDEIVFLESLSSKKHWGYAIGCSFIDCEKASLAIEARFGDEKAFYINGQLRF